MTLSPGDLFPVLEPPPGGLSLLRERLKRRRTSRLWMWCTVPAMAACAAAVVVLVRPASPDPLRARLAGDPFAMALGLSPAGGAITIAPGARGRSAARPMAASTPEVVLFWIDATQEQEP